MAGVVETRAATVTFVWLISPTREGRYKRACEIVTPAYCAWLTVMIGSKRSGFMPLLWNQKSPSATRLTSRR